MEPLEVINQRLLDTYGRGINDLPTYRVVWSTTETEVRRKNILKGFDVVPFISTEPKYPMFPDCWILENIQPNGNNPELMSKVSYEPLWMMLSPDGTPLPYDWEVIEKIIYFHIHRKAPQTQQMLDHVEEEKMEQEKESTLDYLLHDGAFPDKMYDSAVVTVPKEYKSV